MTSSMELQARHTGSHRHHSWLRRRHAQRGLSLIELMISMVLGLIVVSAVLNMYSGSTRSAQFTQGLQSLQENGSYGVSVLQRAWRLAGYSPDDPLEAIDISNSNASTLVVRMKQGYDCQGQSTAANADVAVNTYHFDGSQITCTGNSTTGAMPIIDGVDGFRVLYGIDTDEDGVPERYTAHSTTLEPKQIVALRFALLLNSMDDIRTRKRSETHVLFDDEIEKEDRKARHVFTGTVQLRNGAR